MSGAYVPDNLLRLLLPGRRVRIDVGECDRVAYSHYGYLTRHPREFTGATGVISSVRADSGSGHAYRVAFDTPVVIDSAPLAFGSSWCAACELTPLDDDDNPIKPSLAWTW